MLPELTKEQENLFFDLFAEGFDLVYGSTGKYPWYAALVKDCTEDIDGFLSYRYKEGNKWKELSNEDSRIIPQRVYFNFIRLHDYLGIPYPNRLRVDDLLCVRNNHDDPWEYACFAKFDGTGVLVFADGTNSYTSKDKATKFYKYYKRAD